MMKSSKLLKKKQKEAKANKVADKNTETKTATVKKKTNKKTETENVSNPTE